MVHR
jgi:hypothetical protein